MSALSRASFLGGLTSFINASLDSEQCIAQEPRLLSRTGDPLVSLKPEDAGEFTRAINALAKQGKVAFVAEGFPYRSVLAKTEGLPSEPVSLATLIVWVANAYDYDAERKGNLFLFRKRYTDPNDVPYISQEELQHCLQQVQKAYSRFDPKFPFSPYQIETTNRYPENDPDFRRFMRLLLTTYRDEFRAGTLAVRSLPPFEKEQLRRYCMNEYFYNSDTTIAFDGAAIDQTMFSVAKKTFLWADNSRWFGWLTPKDAPIFCFECDYPKVGKEGPYEVVFAIEPPPSYSGDEGVRILSKGNAQYNIDPTRPDPKDPPLAPTDLPTLGQIVKRCNVPKEQFVADPSVVDKVYTLAGIEAIPPAVLLEACADVYGLRVMTTKDGQTVVAPPVVRPAASLEQLPETVVRVCPLALLRAMHHPDQEWLARVYPQAVRSNAIKFVPPVSISEDIERRSRLPKDRPTPPPDEKADDVERFFQSHETLLFAAARFLRRSALPRAKAAPNRELPFEQATPLEKSAVVFLRKPSTIEALQGIVLSRPPRFVQYFDDLLLKGGFAIDGGGNLGFGLNIGLPRTKDDSTYSRTVHGMGLVFKPNSPIIKGLEPDPNPYRR